MSQHPRKPPLQSRFRKLVHDAEFPVHAGVLVVHIVMMIEGGVRFLGHA